MIELLIKCLTWSFIGRVLRSVLKLKIIFQSSINAYISYLEAIWHFDSPKFFKTLYFNFRVCSFKQACKCPIYLYGKTRIWSLGGNVHFEKDSIKSGIVKWGYDWGYRSNGVTIIRLEGDVYFRGTCLLAQATDVAVFKGAKLVIGDRTEILENSLIYCAESIEVGNNFCFTFQSSMMDTDFHYIIDIDNRRVAKRSSPIFIGNNVWIGNRATIKKGVKIPDNTIVAASYSVLTKDYSQVPSYSILGGCPAKVLASGFSRVWKNEMQNSAAFDDFFLQNVSKEFLKLDKDSLSDYIYGY